MSGIVIRNATVVDGGRQAPADLNIEGGRIVRVSAAGQGDAAAEEIDASGLLALPGGVDAHFHAGDTLGTGVPFPESLGEGTRHAVSGGVTTVLPYVWPLKDEPYGEAAARYIEYFERESLLDFSFHLGVRPDMAQIATLPEAFESGVASFKFHMDYRKTGGGRMTDDDHRIAAMRIIGRHGGRAMFHAENGYIIDALEDQYIAEGRKSWDYHLKSRPTEAEVLAIQQVIACARITGCAVYIPHLTSAEGLQQIEDARAAGVEIDAETCAQYLHFVNDDMATLGNLIKVGPPIREAADRAALWSGVNRGAIKVLASDQSSWSLEKKRSAEGDIFSAIFGIPVVGEMYPLMVSKALREEETDLETVVRVTAEGPARLFGVWPRKGNLGVGADADVVLVDPDAEYAMTASEYSVGWTPFEGVPCRGRFEKVLVGGEVVMDGGVLVHEPSGRHLPVDGRLTGRTDA